MSKEKKSTTTWTQPATPPPPMFAGEKERRLVKQINDEIIERIIGQQIVYFPIDVERTSFHPLYGEAMNKVFGHPIHVYALVKYLGDNTKNEDVFGIDKEGTIEVHFHQKRLTEDQNLYVRVGDYVLYGDKYYELVDTSEPKQLFGQIDNKFEIVGKCNRVREGTFNPQFVNSTVQTTVKTTNNR